jgi:hypothetical protein
MNKPLLAILSITFCLLVLLIFLGVLVTLPIHAAQPAAPAAACDAALYRQINPQVTGPDGYFAFFTPPGQYRLQADGTHLGYALYESPTLTVVAEPIRFNVPLQPAGYRIHLPLVLRSD